MSVSDAETICVSRIDMNIPNTMMRNANNRRGAMRSDRAATGVILSRAAAVASAMWCSIWTCVHWTLSHRARRPVRGLLRVDHRRRVEVGVTVGILGAFAGIDGGIDRHPRAQQVLPGDIARHPKTN